MSIETDPSPPAPAAETKPAAPGMKRHALAITQGAWVALWQMVTRNKWAKGEKQLRRSMRFRRHLRPQSLTAPDTVSDEWLDAAITIDLDERDRETAKLAFQAHMDAGMVDGTEHMERLMLELGFSLKDDE